MIRFTQNNALSPFSSLYKAFLHLALMPLEKCSLLRSSDFKKNLRNFSVAYKEQFFFNVIYQNI